MRSHFQTLILCSLSYSSLRRVTTHKRKFSLQLFLQLQFGKANCYSASTNTMKFGLFPFQVIQHRFQIFWTCSQILFHKGLEDVPFAQYFQ